MDTHFVQHPTEMKDTAYFYRRAAQRKSAHELGHCFILEGGFKQGEAGTLKLQNPAGLAIAACSHRFLYDA